MREPKVEDVMTNLVVTFRLDEPVGHAAERMLGNRISGGPVCDRGKVVGVISESDIARALLPPEQLDHRAVPLNPSMYFTRGEQRTSKVNDQEISVGECMSSEVISVHPRDGLWAAARTISHRGIKRLPVVDDEGYLVGIVARGDIMRAMTQEAAAS
jgi:CBS domain-containing protein